MAVGSSIADELAPEDVREKLSIRGEGSVAASSGVKPMSVSLPKRVFVEVFCKLCLGDASPSVPEIIARRYAPPTVAVAVAVAVVPVDLRSGLEDSAWMSVVWFWWGGLWATAVFV
jgi:hypothetical protein